MTKKDKPHNSVHDDLINEYRNTPQERQATPEEIESFQGILGKTILGDGIFYDVENKKTIAKEPSKIMPTKAIQKYLLPLPQRTIRQYTPELEAVRDSMELNNERYNAEGVLKDIDYIINHYRTFLSLHDAINIYLLLIHRRLEISSEENKKNIDDTLALLNYLQQYESHMDAGQKDDFYYNVGIACFCKASFTQNQFFYDKSVKAFDAILDAEHRNTFQKNIEEHLLTDERYKEILYYKANSLYSLGEYKKAITTIQEFLDACKWDPKTHTYEFSDDKNRIIDFLFLKGEISEELKEYTEAIQSYEQYLSLNPDDEFVQKNLEYLKSL